MKLTEVKHKHLLTDILKVLLFSIIMLVPILSVATRCLYVIVNKNAYQSAEITQTTYDKIQNERQTNSEVLEGYYYYLDNYSFNDMVESIGTGLISFDLIKGQVYNYTNDFPTFLFVEDNFYLNIDFDFTGSDANFNGQPSQYADIDFSDSGAYVQGIVYMKVINLSQTLKEELPFYFEELLEDQKYYYSYEEVQATTLDNVFEYSVNKLNDNALINWTQQTAIYTGVNTMTTQLGITNAVIPMLIVYWFLMTVIYIIIDIVIKLFTYLTHMIGNKTT